jgi:hypothetical protein
MEVEKFSETLYFLIDAAASPITILPNYLHIVPFIRMHVCSETQQRCSRLFPHLLAVKPQLPIKTAARLSNQATASTHLPLTSHSLLFPHRWAKQFSRVF